MQRAGTIAEYARAPVGRWFGGTSFVHFFAEPTLCGTLFFGRPDASAIALLVQAIAVELPPHSAVHRAFVDTSHLEDVDPDAFRALAEYVGPRADELGANVSRQAIVHAGGAIGAVVTGFYDVTPSATPERTRFFTDRGEALHHLGVRNATSVLAELDSIRASASRSADPVAALQAWLRANPRGASIARGAVALGVTPHALRAELRTHGTSFRREVARARLANAQRRLEATDEKLGAIALDVGCASLQHFTTFFRRETGVSPSAWRARQRR